MTEPPFGRVAIAGNGLIGASIGQAVRRAWPEVEVTALDAGDDIAPVAGADLGVLAGPGRANTRVLDPIQPHITRETVVTDTGSTKRAICAAASARPAIDFIGGHPLAGGAENAAAQ